VADADVRLAGPITAGLTYVASYTVPIGRYAADVSYFERGPATSSPLVAPATAPGSGNSLYKVGSGFPDSSYRGTNYWVDVVVTIPAGGGGGGQTAVASSTVSKTTLPVRQPPKVVLRSSPVQRRAPRRGSRVLAGRAAARRQRRSDAGR